jgi:hypothetical protein
MNLTGLEQILVASLVGGVGTIAGYVIGMRGKMTAAECLRCRGECSERVQAKIDAVAAKYAELSLRQDRVDKSIDDKLDILFRMVRAIVMHLPIDAETKAEIINERSGK